MNVQTISRDAAVARIRRELIALRETEKSACDIASERNILCHGFARDTDAELRYRYADVLPDAPVLDREQLEQRASQWQIARTQKEGALLCCDVQHRFYETCRGWDDFTNEQLATYHREVTGVEVRVNGKRELPVI
jgi:hypothetical protein